MPYLKVSDLSELEQQFYKQANRLVNPTERLRYALLMADAHARADQGFVFKWTHHPGGTWTCELWREPDCDNGRPQYINEAQDISLGLAGRDSPQAAVTEAELVLGVWEEALTPSP